MFTLGNFIQIYIGFIGNPGKSLELTSSFCENNQLLIRGEISVANFRSPCKRCKSGKNSVRGTTNYICLLVRCMSTESKFLVGDQPHSKLITFSYRIRREFFSRNFISPPN
jgi:methylphosphotriester-DNA--protein-cysteine methyltransferase